MDDLIDKAAGPMYQVQHRAVSNIEVTTAVSLSHYTPCLREAMAEAGPLMPVGRWVGGQSHWVGRGMGEGVRWTN